MTMEEATAYVRKNAKPLPPDASDDERRNLAHAQWKLIAHLMIFGAPTQEENK